MENTEQSVIEKIATLAPAVAEAVDTHAAALTVERTAEAAVLDRAIALVKPALRGLCSRLLAVDDDSSGQNGLHPVSRREYLPGAYLILVNDEDKDSDTTGNTGSRFGTLLLLRYDGVLLESTLEGSWSRWQGAWQTAHRTLSDPLSSAEVMESENLSEVLGVILKALEAERGGKRVERTQAALERAEKLTAIVSLAK